jgi:hypothetical protein
LRNQVNTSLHSVDPWEFPGGWLRAQNIAAAVKGALLDR